MIKNNKGVTLVELLIVIVVMGIIAAFAIPAVGTIIDNTQKDAILADAIAIENAANLFCAQTTCEAVGTETLTWAELSSYVTGIDGADYYEFDSVASPAADVTGDVIIATLTTNGWEIQLNGTSATVTAGGYDWMPTTAADRVPSQNDRSKVTDAS
ncbi:MAG: Fimbrial protein precursor [Candidatus Izimaplasma bacterium HR2]|nr:MAG: Fimbrial protein precursor [Candidatus Izimaplasma bacterium HR2]